MTDILSVGSATYSSQISTLAAQLMAPQRAPVDALQAREDMLNKRSSTLGTLGTALSALKSALDNLDQPGTLSPFAPMTAQSSDASILTGTATTSATAGTYSITVNHLARASTFASNVYTDTNTAISGAGTGTFAFSLTLGGATYSTSVTVNPGDTDRTVLANVASAINAAASGKVTAVVVTQATGQSRLSLASVATGTSNSITFTDTDGLLGTLGITNAAQANDTTGGYIYKDLGNHELDASITLNGLTVYRESNTVSDLVTGLTLSLKSANPATPVNLTVQPDADTITSTVKDFLTKYNAVITQLNQATTIDTHGGQNGVFALDPVFSQLAPELRWSAATIVGSAAAGQPNTLAGLGIQAAADGTLSITDETAFKDLVATNPTGVAAVFNATDGVVASLENLVGGFTGPGGSIASSQNVIGLEVQDVNDEMARMNDMLAKQQAVLEDELARDQEMLQSLNDQNAQMQQVLGLTSTTGS